MNLRTMKKKNFDSLILLCVMTMALLSSCSPKVTTDMFTYAYDPVATDKVMLLSNAADTAIMQPLIIGRVEVVPRSVKPEDEYVMSMGLAVREAAQNGGNVLVIDNRPLKGNMIRGIIGRSEGETIDSLAYTPQRIQKLQMQRQQYQQVDPTGLKVNDMAQSTLNGGILKISAGPVWTMSKIYYVENYQMKSVKGQCGWIVDCSLSHIGKKGYGFGGDLYFSNTHLDIPTNSMMDADYTFLYFGPHFIAGGKIGTRWRGDVSLGMGLALYSDANDVQAGFGMKTAGNLEFLLTEKIGIGVEVFTQKSFFKKPKDVQLPDDEAYGYQHLGVMLGARMHF